MKIEDLYARPGEPVLPKWESLIRWAKSLRVRPAVGVRVSETPNGTLVTVDPAPLPAMPFAVGLGAGFVVVPSGLVENTEPTIDGKLLSEKPKLSLKGQKPKNGDRTFVCLRVVPDGSNWPEDPENIAIVHRESPVPEEGEGLQPLAILHWIGGTPTRITQIVRHNLRWFITGDGRQFFSAV